MNITNITKVAIIMTVLSTTTVYATGYVVDTGTSGGIFKTTRSPNMFAVGPILNLAGIGLEARMPITQDWFARASARGFSISVADNLGGELNLKAGLRLFTVPVMVDYYPIDGSGFRVSGGVAYNGNKFTLTAKPVESVTLFGNTYTPAQIGKVQGTLKFGNAIAPLVSIGYDNSLLEDDGRFSLNAELGVMYAGNPKVKISSSGIAGGVLQATGLQNDLTREAKREVKKVRKYLQWYPVLGIGFKINL